MREELAAKLTLILVAGLFGLTVGGALTWFMLFNGRQPLDLVRPPENKILYKPD